MQGSLPSPCPPFTFNPALPPPNVIALDPILGVCPKTRTWTPMACKNKGSLKAWGKDEGVKKAKDGMLKGRFANWT